MPGSSTKPLAARRPKRHESGDYLTNGRKLVRVSRVMDDGALVEDAMAPHDITSLDWREIARAWKRVSNEG